MLLPGSPRIPLSGAAVSLQARPALEALSTRGAAEMSRCPAVDPVVVVQDAGQAESLTTRQAHVLLLLCVDARVIA